MGGWLLSIIREEASRRTYPPIYEAARIEFGQLGDKAGVIGAAGIWYQLQSKRIKRKATLNSEVLSEIVVR